MPAYDSKLFEPPAPLARVTLRHLSVSAKVTDVPMLLDCGADISLIPQAAVRELGAVVNAGEGYELMSFDGTKSVAQAVQLDLLFLGRAFKGRFLLIDQVWGIVGRDILNHLAILLDGPGLTWSEQIDSRPRATSG